ncbi:hypothetical protein HYV91_00495 [Candidatus Wolfebacteria bacterium]|nr:hypothetical protein [Candidatus Wolfebacteria bacterium]
MDIFSHGLWAGAGAKAVNLKLNFWLAFFWGVFPDLFAFAIPFVWVITNLILGNLTPADLPRPEESEPPSQNTLWIFRLASSLYNLSHSLVVFFLIFGIVFIIFKRPFWEMSGWLLHILFDIPTHSYRFFPTPFLWPLSGFKLDGFSWAHPWFIALNYGTLLIVYWFLRKRS